MCLLPIYIVLLCAGPVCVYCLYILYSYVQAQYVFIHKAMQEVLETDMSVVNGNLSQTCFSQSVYVNRKYMHYHDKHIIAIIKGPSHQGTLY